MSIRLIENLPCFPVDGRILIAVRAIRNGDA
jgi:hypothetical protein